MKMAEECKGSKHSTQVWSAMFILWNSRHRKINSTRIPSETNTIIFNHAFSAKWLKNIFCDIHTKKSMYGMCAHFAS